MRKKFVMKASTLLAIVFVPCLLLCTSTMAAESIKIGLTTDFSGVTAQFGVIETPVHKMVIEELNKAGGINGRPLELFVLDNGADPAKMLANLKLHKEKNKCVAMLTGTTSSVCLTAAQWCEENKISGISPDPMTDRIWVHEGKAWYFRTQAPNIVVAEALVRRAKSLGHKKIGYEGSTLGWGVDGLEAVKTLAPKYGLEFVGHVLCEPKSKDLTIQAKKLKETGATAVIMGEYEAEIGVWARALKGMGWNPLMLSLSGGNLYASINIYPHELFEGFNTAMLHDDTKPLVKEVWDRYEKYTGKRYEDEKAPRTWDAVHLMIEAIKLSGNPDNPEAIRDGYYKIKDFPVALGSKTMKGNFEIGRNHILKVEDIPIYVVKSGKPTSIQ
jgi:branched-chain amino acid transport system substrate-binding protein